MGGSRPGEARPPRRSRTIRNAHYLLDPAQLFTSVPLAIGGVLWITTYILIIRRCFKDQAYGIPLFAICLNVTWEMLVLAACVPDGDPLGLCPKPEAVGVLRFAEAAGVMVDVFWFILDCFLVYQLFRFGRRSERIPHLRQHWFKFLGITLLLSLLLQHSFATFYDDDFLIRDAWIINMVMSLSFLYLFWDRVETGLAGISWAAAWTKLGGNFFYAVGLTIVHMRSTHEFLDGDSSWFMLTLFTFTLFFDVVYLIYLARARRRGRPLVAASPAPA